MVLANSISYDCTSLELTYFVDQIRIGTVYLGFGVDFIVSNSVVSDHDHMFTQNFLIALIAIEMVHSFHMSDLYYNINVIQDSKSLGGTTYRERDLFESIHSQYFPVKIVICTLFSYKDQKLLL